MVTLKDLREAYQAGYASVDYNRQCLVHMIHSGAVNSLQAEVSGELSDLVKIESAKYNPMQKLMFKLGELHAVYFHANKGTIANAIIDGKFLQTSKK